jgi:hypothetical protein
MSKQVIKMSVLPGEPQRDGNGMLTQRHVAAGPHVEHNGRYGELLLCGAVLLYDTFSGEAPGAADCPRCRALDC